MAVAEKIPYHGHTIRLGVEQGKNGSWYAIVQIEHADAFGVKYQGFLDVPAASTPAMARAAGIEVAMAKIDAGNLTGRPMLTRDSYLIVCDAIQLANGQFGSRYCIFKGDKPTGLPVHKSELPNEVFASKAEAEFSARGGHCQVRSRERKPLARRYSVSRTEILGTAKPS